MKCLDCDWTGTVAQAKDHEDETGHICLATPEELGEFDFSGDGLPD